MTVEKKNPGRVTLLERFNEMKRERDEASAALLKLTEQMYSWLQSDEMAAMNRLGAEHQLAEGQAEKSQNLLGRPIVPDIAVYAVGGHSTSPGG